MNNNCKFCIARLRELAAEFNAAVLADSSLEERRDALQRIAEGAHVINRTLNDAFLEGGSSDEELTEIAEAANEAGRLAFRARRALRS